jgi:hypothetical protein
VGRAKKGHRVWTRRPISAYLAGAVPSIKTKKPRWGRGKSRGRFGATLGSGADARVEGLGDEVYASDI